MPLRNRLPKKSWVPLELKVVGTFLFFLRDPRIEVASMTQKMLELGTFHLFNGHAGQEPRKIGGTDSIYFGPIF